LESVGLGYIFIFFFRTLSFSGLECIFIIFSKDLDSPIHQFVSFYGQFHRSGLQTWAIETNWRDFEQAN
jgi:hypothetical protein